MRKSTNYEMNLFDEDEFYSEELFNENTEKIDEVMKSLDTPEYDVSEQTNVEKLSSGESLRVALRKLAKAVADYISHKADQVAHITAAERTAWNAKLGVEKIAANLTTDADGMVLAAAMGKNLKEQIDTNANAISTLNSNKVSYSEENITIMDVYSNLNDYTTPKIYRTYIMADASISFENCPITCKFVLLVQKFNTATYQTIYPMDISEDAHIYKRSLFEDIWSDWIVLG